MIVRIQILAFILSVATATAGFDRSYMWPGFIHRPEVVGDSMVYSHNGSKTVYLHSKLHGIDALHWDLISVDVGRGGWGIRMDFSSVGYKRFYRRNRFIVISRFNLRKRISIIPSLEICSEKYQNSGHYTGITGGIGIAYTARKCRLESGFADIELRNPYKNI
jgi:hypothetical protein